MRCVLIFPRIKFSVAHLCAALLVTSSFVLTLSAFTQEQSSSPSTTAPDNSAKNKNHNVTADQQGENAADREMTKKIRQSVMADKSLSTYARNVKVITLNGMVTLKGPVRSQEEEQKIVDLATDVAGSPDKVINKLSIKS
jgi:osmotically-inducible protein OsmY